MCAQVSNHCVAEEERPLKRLRARDGDDQARAPQAESHDDLRDETDKEMEVTRNPTQSV